MWWKCFCGCWHVPVHCNWNLVQVPWGPARQENIPSRGSVPLLTQRCNSSGFCSGWTVTKCWDANSSANKMSLLAEFFPIVFLQVMPTVTMVRLQPITLTSAVSRVCVLIHLSVSCPFCFALWSLRRAELCFYFVLRPMGLCLKNRILCPMVTQARNNGIFFFSKRTDV